MEMEEKQVAKHTLVLNSRKKGTFSGIVDVISFDLNEILLETELGRLHIKGRDLHMTRLSLEKGEVDMEGQVDSLIYADGSQPGKKSSVFGKMFS